MALCFIEFAMWQHRGRSLTFPTASCINKYTLRTHFHPHSLAVVCIRRIRMKKSSSVLSAVVDGRNVPSTVVDRDRTCVNAGDGL